MSARERILGIDIGGTFTDFVYIDRTTGELKVGKELTTPDEPSRAVFTGSERIAEQIPGGLEGISHIAHATTLVTNAIIERKGVCAGLITTQGHRDLLTIGRESRYDHYDLRLRFPEPLVPRRLSREVEERIAWDGKVLTPLDLQDARQAISELVDEGVDSLAICLLHSYQNPIHEQQLRDLVSTDFPDLDCCISSDVAPEVREFERASTTAGNAYVRPIVRTYLETLEREFRSRKFAGELHVMLSNGGLSSPQDAAKVPIRAVESGPAAGVTAAAYYGRMLGRNNLLAFDMGGTTAKMSFLEDNQPKRVNSFEVARIERFKKGSGLPLLIPVVELIEIGAGGGSIASVDSLGLLRVGPASAGASPGPASYGRGGTLPTVTDADVILGYIEPARFLGGEMQLDSGAAAVAIDAAVGEILELSTRDAAQAIFNMVSENMATATKLYAAEEGIDLSRSSMFVSGGAGPIHACRLAQLLGIGEVVFPFGAGVASAIGLCVAPPAVEHSRSLMSSTSDIDWGIISNLYSEMEAVALKELAAAGAAEEDVDLIRTVDMRFSGQGYEIEVPLDGIPLQKGSKEQVDAAFVAAYTAQYGRTPGVGESEVLTWRLRAASRQDDIRISPTAAAESSEPLEYRDMVFAGYREPMRCPIYSRYGMSTGTAIEGPAAIEERETTVIIPPGARLVVDEFRNLIVTLTAGQQ